MALGTIGRPLSRFPLAMSADKRKIGDPAQLKGLFKLLDGSSEVFLVKVNLCQEAVKRRKVLSLEADEIQFLKGLIQHLKSKTEFGIEKGNHPIVRIDLEGSLIDPKECVWISPTEIEILLSG